MDERAARWRELAFIYRKLAGARVRADWQYRTPFVLYTITQGLVTFIDFLEIAVIFGQVDQLGDWSASEVAFLYGTSCVAFYMADVFISQCERGPQRVKLGTFDVLLTRPLGTLFHLCADDFAFRRLGKLVQGGTIFVIALAWVDVDWTMARALVVAGMLVCGTAIFAAVWVTTSALGMWMIEATEVMNSFTYGSAYVTEFPLQVMTRWLRRLFTFVIPAAFVNYYPSLYVLGKDDPFGAPGWVSFTPPLVALALVLVARLAWRSAERHYRSTGS